MKTKFKYISTFLLLLLIGASCKDNDNWVIIEDVQPGNYVTGDATIYSAAATASEFTRANLDGFDDVNDVQSIYTWLKAGETFQVSKVDGSGELVDYGKGSTVTSDYDTYELIAGGTPFSVSKDGLYFLVLNNADNQLTIVEADFGIIGDATPGAWNSETKFASTTYDDKYNTVEMKITGVTLNNKEMKFRYAQTWGLAIPYKGSTVTIHANMGGTSDSSTTLSSSFAECKAGGGNFKLSAAGVYEVTLKLELRSVKFTGKAVCTDEDTSSAKLPEKMYMTGSPYNWDWTLATELIPVYSHDGNFWGVYYLNANDMLKFNSARDWNGDQFGAESSAAIGYGDYATGESDIAIANSGFYLVWVQCSLSADKKSVINRFVLAEPVPYLVGVCAPGGWTDICSDAAKFTLDNNVYKSPAFANDGELRMCILLDGVEWWQSEFMVFDGQIVYRGAGGDQERINGVAGQIATLDFINNTGTIQ